jgi:hypothetical protein
VVRGCFTTRLLGKHSYARSTCALWHEVSYTYRALGPDEVGRLPLAATAGYPIPVDGSLPVVAIDETGEIVAVWYLLMIAHAEPLWIRHDHRKSPVILKGLAKVMRVALKELRIRQAVCVLTDAVPVAKRIAKWLGAKPFHGSLYLFDAAVATSNVAPAMRGK